MNFNFQTNKTTHVDPDLHSIIINGPFEPTFPPNGYYKEEEYSFETQTNSILRGNYSSSINDLLPIDLIYVTDNSYVFKMVNQKSHDHIIAKLPNGKINKNVFEMEVKMCQLVSRLDDSEKYFMQFQGLQEFVQQGSKIKIMIFECGFDSMKNILKFKKQYLESELVFILMKHLCPALRILHSNNISHFDVKPDNIILCEKNGEYFYKISDFGSAIQLKNDSDHNIDQDQIISLSYFYSESDLKEKLNINISIDAFSHDLYTLIITSLEMMGLTSKEIITIKEKPVIDSYPPNILENYPKLIPILIKFLKRTDGTIENFLTHLNEINVKKPEDGKIVDLVRKDKLKNFIKERGKYDSVIADNYTNFYQKMSLNTLKSSTDLNKNTDNYFKTLDEVIDRQTTLKPLGKKIQKMICRFEAFDVLGDLKTAKSWLDKITDFLKKSPPKRNSEIRDIYILGLYAYIYQKLHQFEDRKKIFLEIYWKCCNSFMMLSGLGNLLKCKVLKQFFYNFATVFNHSIPLKNSYHYDEGQNLVQLLQNNINTVNETTEEFMSWMNILVEECEEDRQGLLSCFKNTLAFRVLASIPQFCEKDSFDENSYVNCLDFQFLRLSECEVFSNSQMMYEHFLYTSQVYNGYEISYMNARIHFYLAQKILIQPNNPQIFVNLKKSFNIWQWIRKNLKYDGNFLIRRIDLLKKLMNSYDLFEEFEFGKKKKKIQEDRNKFMKIMNYLEMSKVQKEYGDTENLKSFLENLDCPYSCKSLIFYDLFENEEFHQVRNYLEFVKLREKKKINILLK